jgi:hypothetical protein
MPPTLTTAYDNLGGTPKGTIEQSEVATHRIGVEPSSGTAFAEKRTPVFEGR